MSANYKQQLANNAVWEAKYKYVVDTIGVNSPEGYNVLPDSGMPKLLSAMAKPGEVPVSTNPAAELYISGLQRQLLMSSASTECSTGCIGAVNKPDPRSREVKPLYDPTIFSAPQGNQLPNPYNVTGMY